MGSPLRADHVPRPREPRQGCEAHGPGVGRDRQGAAAASARLRGRVRQGELRPRTREVDRQRLQAGRDQHRSHDDRDPVDRVRSRDGGRTAGRARLLRRPCDARPRRHRQPSLPDGGGCEVRDPARGHGGRDRLFALLHPARARGARAGPFAARGVAADLRDVWPHRAHLRPHGADRDVGHVLQRVPDLHVVSGGDDDHGRRRDPRLDHGAAGDAVLARRPGEQGTHPVPAPRRRGRAGTEGLGLGARPRPAASGAVGLARGGLPRRALAPGAAAAHPVPGFQRPSAEPRLPEDARPHPDRVRTADYVGEQTPAVVAVHARYIKAQRVHDAIAAMQRLALATGQMTPPTDVRLDSKKTTASVSIMLKGNGNDSQSKRALATLRNKVIPATVGKVPGVTADVTGSTAATVDFNHTMTRHMPMVFGFALVLVFLLLLITFRSIVVPIKAVILNLLSVSAAYGVLVLVFQHTWAEGIIGFRSNGAIVSWLPMFLFVILFGISMDYHVFILTRIKELVDGGMDTEQAVAEGIKKSASVVTSAASVMVGVFAIFAMLNVLEMKQMGVGLAAAILIDATIIRAVLLPATMKLLGEWNWYFPSWLEWIPRVRTEGTMPPAETPVPGSV